jgi:hypothetical protein
MTKLASKLPKDHGLSAYKFTKEPGTIHAVIALIDCSKVTTDTDTGDKEPTVRVLRVETINKADLGDGERLLRAAIRKRTGATVLDGFEDGLDQDIKNAFGQPAEPSLDLT